MLQAQPELFAILIPILVIFIPVVVLAIIVAIKLIVKNVQKSKKRNDALKIDFVDLFGGDANIENINVVMSRVNVTVKDVKLVKLEELQAKNMGVLVVGNVVKCASKEFAEAVSLKINK